MSATFRIDAMGAQGDGIAHVEGEPVFLPFTLAGETVTAAREGKRADLIAVVEPSVERVEPPCRHFGDCGGCVLQHWAPAPYLEWKRRKVVDALAGRGIETQVAPVITCAPHTRRRATFAARRQGGSLSFGYHAALSHRIVDIEECPILLPRIVDRLPALRELARLLADRRDVLRLTVTQTDSGLDVSAEGAATLDAPARLTLAAFGTENRLARLTVGGEVIIEPQRPRISFGEVPVELPPGGFLQATKPAEDAMAELVTLHLKSARMVADLFSGAGTFALQLARRSTIHAVEADAAALAALDRGFRQTGGVLKQVTAEKRDLFRRPLTAKDLSRYDGLVFDPPRAGAEDQSRQIARSNVAKVAAVSCNPVTLARDLAILIEGGYALKSVTPVDQFLWSAHVEAVALLEKPVRRR